MNPDQLREAVADVEAFLAGIEPPESPRESFHHRWSVAVRRVEHASTGRRGQYEAARRDAQSLARAFLGSSFATDEMIRGLPGWVGREE